MNFEVNSNDNYTIVTCNIQKLDTIVAPELKSQLLLLDKSGVSNYILDLSNVKYCDSSGLSALLVGNRFAKTAEGKFVVCGLNQMLKSLLQYPNYTMCLILHLLNLKQLIIFQKIIRKLNFK